jgi:hypothetical protein
MTTATLPTEPLAVPIQLDARSLLGEKPGAFREVIDDLLMADEITKSDDWRDKVQRFPL